MPPCEIVASPQLPTPRAGITVPQSNRFNWQDRIDYAKWIPLIIYQFAWWIPLSVLHSALFRIQSGREQVAIGCFVHFGWIVSCSLVWRQLSSTPCCTSRNKAALSSIRPASTLQLWAVSRIDISRYCNWRLPAWYHDRGRVAKSSAQRLSDGLSCCASFLPGCTLCMTGFHFW